MKKRKDQIGGRLIIRLEQKKWRARRRRRSCRRRGGSKGRGGGAPGEPSGYRSRKGVSAWMAESGAWQDALAKGKGRKAHPADGRGRRGPLAAALATWRGRASAKRRR